MHKANSIIINAPKSDIFETAANLELWPKILPHYRYIRYLARGPQRNLVVMAAVRSGIPISWTSEQVKSNKEEHIMSQSRGAVSFEPLFTAEEIGLGKEANVERLCAAVG